MKPSYRLPIAAMLFSLLPAAARACSACILADPRTSGTYLKMTLMMSALPLSLLGGLTYWLWRRYSSRSDRLGTLRRPVEIQSGANVLEHHRGLISRCRSLERLLQFEYLRNLRKAIN